MSVSAALPFLFFSALNGKSLNAVPLQVPDTLRSHHAKVAPHANLKETVPWEDKIAGPLVVEAKNKLALFVKEGDCFRDYMEKFFSGRKNLEDNESKVTKISKYLFGDDPVKYRFEKDPSRKENQSGFFTVKFWSESEWKHYIFVLISKSNAGDDRVHLFHSHFPVTKSGDLNMENELTSENFFKKIDNLMTNKIYTTSKLKLAFSNFDVIPKELFLPSSNKETKKDGVYFMVSEKQSFLKEEAEAKINEIGWLLEQSADKKENSSKQ